MKVYQMTSVKDFADGNKLTQTYNPTPLVW